jgi:hypothetical protein
MRSAPITSRLIKMARIKTQYSLQLTQKQRDEYIAKAQRAYAKVAIELEQFDHPIMRLTIGQLMIDHAQAQIDAMEYVE